MIRKYKGYHGSILTIASKICVNSFHIARFLNGGCECSYGGCKIRLKSQEGRIFILTEEEISKLIPIETKKREKEIDMKATAKNIIIEVEALEAFSENKAGLLLHNSLNDLPTEGVVISVGPNYNGTLKKKDKVKFREHPGDDFIFEGRRFYVTTESKIYGTIE